jgi:hypothetical protein
MDKRIKRWSGRLFYAVIAVVMTFGLLLAPASAPPVSAAEVNAEWDKVDTPSMDDWKVATGSDLYVPALGADGQRLYVIGSMWVDENADGWINYTEETPRLWKSEDGGATWDDITENVMEEIRDEFYGSDETLNWTDMVAWFNFITAAMYDTNFIAMGAYLGDMTDPDNMQQVVLVSTDGGEEFELLPYPIQDTSAGTNLTDIFGINVAPEEVDGVREIAICGIEDPNRSVVNPGVPNGDEEGRIYRYRTGGLIGRWEDAATGKPGWINCTAVTWVYFSGLFKEDSTIVAVTHNTKIDIPGFHVNCFPHTGNQSYFQTGTWSGSNVNWNEEASRGKAALLSNEPAPWWVIKGSTSGIGLPLDYDGSDKNTRYAWVTLNTAKEAPVAVDQTTTGTIYRVVNGDAELLAQQVEGRPWLAMVFYLGMIDKGKAVAGVLGKGHVPGILGSITNGLNLRTEDCEGVQVYRNDGISDMDICCQVWKPACKPPTGHGAALSIIAPPGGTKVYCVTTALTILMNPKIPGEIVPNCHMWDKYDEGAFSVSFDEGDTWNQIGLIDTDIDYLTDVAQSPDCNTTYLASTNLNLTRERNTPPTRPKWTYYGVCDSVFFKSKNLAEAIPFAKGYDDTWFRVWNGLLTNNTELNSCETPEIGLIRLAPEETGEIETVYFVDRGSDTVYYDGNKGLGCWETGSSTVDEISDLAVQDEATIYALGFDASVAVNDDHGFGASWSSTMDSKVDDGHTIAVDGEGNVLVGGADGKVAYSDDDLDTFLDGEASFTKLDDIGDGRVHVTFDSYFDSNSVVYAAVSNVDVDCGYDIPVNDDDNGIYRWVIDESSSWTDLGECAGTATPTETQLGLGPSCDTVEVGYYGIVLSNAEGNPETDATTGGVLYAAFYDADGNVTGVARCLNPAEEVACGEAEWDYLIEEVSEYHGAFTLEPSSLRICGCLSPDTNSKLWAIDDALYYNATVIENVVMNGRSAKDPRCISRLGRLWTYEDCYAKAGPELLSPANDALVDADPCYCWNDAFTLKWDRQCDACSYNLQISLDEDFTEVIVDISGKDGDCDEIDYEPSKGSAPSYVVENGALGTGSCGTTFYWRVRSADAETDEIIHSPWSEVRSFTVAVGPMAELTLTNPSNGATGISVSNIPFTWDAVADSTGYEFSLVNAETEVEVVSATAVSGTTYTYTGTLSHSTSYYWTVKAMKDTTVFGDATATFTTGAEGVIPPEPTIASWLWAIIALGAVVWLVILVLIFRTRRV